MNGKVYSGEKAVISLTSWKRRINTVGLTLFSLLKQCPGFHIVLSLSVDEFPRKIDDLPIELQHLVYARLIEILWCEQDWKVFMKTFPALLKYRHIPVISADDDCLYVCNYAECLYGIWKQNPKSIVSNDGTTFNEYTVTRGQNTLYTFDTMYRAINLFRILMNSSHKDWILSHPEDDAFNAAYYYLADISVKFADQPSFYVFTEQQASSNALHRRITYAEYDSVDAYKSIMLPYFKLA